jgi:hypothetical protein
METKPLQSISEVMRELEGLASRSATKLSAAADELRDVFTELDRKLARHAEQTSDATSHAELRARPAPNLDELSDRLERIGPEALTLRERKLLLAAPGRLAEQQLRKLLRTFPTLAPYAARTCFSVWPRYVREPWGAAYEAAIRDQAASSELKVLAAQPVSTAQLLSRAAPGGETALAHSLPRSSIELAYERLKLRIGVRDSWLLSSSALAAWLTASMRRGDALDESLRVILRHNRLRALLLPTARSAAGAAAAVRSHVTVQAQTVAAFLAAAYSEPQQLSKSSLAALTDYLLRSTFDDPRAALRSEGWNEVSRLYEPGFRRLLASLCEQDLEVFFKHAMHEPDRHEFWLRYLPELERTGCVLDTALRKRLDAKLLQRPELHGAIERAYPFRRTSDAQAFFLVFRQIVVVEFSHSGNAAYVYKREWFEKRLEQRIRKGLVEDSDALKVMNNAAHRILHTRGWQNNTAAWLASEGVHARGRHYP